MSNVFSSPWTFALDPKPLSEVGEPMPPSIFIRIELAKFGVIGLGMGAGGPCASSTCFCETATVYTMDEDFEEAGYMKPLSTADDEADDDSQDVCKSGDGCWVKFRGAGLEPDDAGGG